MKESVPVGFRMHAVENDTPVTDGNGNVDMASPGDVIVSAVIPDGTGTSYTYSLILHATGAAVLAMKLQEEADKAVAFLRATNASGD